MRAIDIDAEARIQLRSTIAQITFDHHAHEWKMDKGGTHGGDHHFQAMVISLILIFVI